MSELVDIPMTELAPDTLQALIESFVLREGTDYGVEEVPLATKVGQVVRQLQRGEAQILFDPETESVDIRRVLGK
ncbi:MAG TPA: YheU family protein [Steroidobacteraceae bacterium]